MTETTTTQHVEQPAPEVVETIDGESTEVTHPAWVAQAMLAEAENLADEPAQDAEDVEQPDDAQEDAQEDRKGNKAARDAAKYRRQLRALQAEHEQTKTELEAARRQVVEQMTAASGVAPAALWATGATAADLLDAEGRVDPARVRLLTDQARQTFGSTHPSVSQRPVDLLEAGTRPNVAPSFVEAFKPRAH